MAIPWIAAAILGSAFLGNKAANKATNRSNEMFDYEKQLFEEFGRPQAEMELQRMRQQQPYNQYLQGISQSMLGMPTQSSGGAGGLYGAIARAYGGSSGISNQVLPSWMQPGATPNVPNAPTLGAMPGAYRPGQDVYGALNTIGQMNLSDYMSRQAGNRAQLAQQQGIRLSAEQARQAPGVQQAFLEAKSRESANAALMRSDLERQYSEDMLNRYLQQAGLQSSNWGQQLQKIGFEQDIGRANRGEQASNFYNLQNILSGYGASPSQTAGPWAGYLGDIGKTYQNQAANYGQAFGQGLNAMGQAAGKWQGYQSMNPYAGGGQNQNPQQTWMTNYTNPYESRYGPGF